MLKDRVATFYSTQKKRRKQGAWCLWALFLLAAIWKARRVDFSLTIWFFTFNLCIKIPVQHIHQLVVLYCLFGYFFWHFCHSSSRTLNVKSPPESYVKDKDSLFTQQCANSVHIYTVAVLCRGPLQGREWAILWLSYFGDLQTGSFVLLYHGVLPGVLVAQVVTWPAQRQVCIQAAVKRVAISHYALVEEQCFTECFGKTV